MFQRLSTQQVSLLLTPLLLHLQLPPPLLCSSLQSHIRRTIFPIIETSFRRFVRFVRFVGFQQAHLSVGQSDCLKSREEIAESSTLHNVLPCCLPVLQSPSLPFIHPTACLHLNAAVNRSRFRQAGETAFSWPPLGRPEDRIHDRRSNCANRIVI